MGVLGMRAPPSRSNFFHFMQFSAEILLNNRFLPQTQELAPPMGNPGSATELIFNSSVERLYLFDVT